MHIYLYQYCLVFHGCMILILQIFLQFQTRREDLFDRLSFPSGSSRSSSKSRTRSASTSKSRSRSRRRYAHPYDSDSDMDTLPPLQFEGNVKCLLDVMNIDLTNMDIYTSVRKKSRKITRKITEVSNPKKINRQSRVFDDNDDELKEVVWEFGSYKVVREGRPLLKEKCALKLQVEHNLDTFVSRAGE